MSDQFIGEIRIFAGNFAPQDWAFCQGQTLQINQNPALYSLIGTTYGGNGTTTFQLPDLRGRSVVGFGQGNGLSAINIGQTGGTENINQVPAHTHALNNSAATGTTDNPTGNIIASGSGSPVYTTGTPNKTLSNLAIASTGNAAVPIRNPFLGLNFIIALAGIYPPRP
jgi:microcystin-dependent protein